MERLDPFAQPAVLPARRSRSPKGSLKSHSDSHPPTVLAPVAETRHRLHTRKRPTSWCTQVSIVAGHERVW